MLKRLSHWHRLRAQPKGPEAVSVSPHSDRALGTRSDAGKPVRSMQYASKLLHMFPSWSPSMPMPMARRALSLKLLESA